MRGELYIYAESGPGSLEIEKPNTRFENVSGRHIVRGGAFPVVHGYTATRFLVYSARDKEVAANQEHRGGGRVEIPLGLRRMYIGSTM